MPALSSAHLFLGLAILLICFGVVGLAPGLLQVVRRRRLVSNLAGLRVDEDETEAHFNRALYGVSNPVPEAPEAQNAAGVVKAPLAAVEPAPIRDVMPAAVDKEASPPEVERTTSQVTAEPAVQDELDAGVEDEHSEEEEDIAESQTVSKEAAEDDFLALFREAKATAVAPEALNDAYDRVAAADLLAEARALRDLLRRAA